MGTLIPERGERALLVGQTGSGKTTLATWLIQRLAHYPRIVIDTKHEPKFLGLPDTAVVEDWEAVAPLLRRSPLPRHVVVRPSLTIATDPEALDGLLMSHYRHLRGVPIYIDEGYQLHVNGRAGPGLMALLTRGRSRGITTIIGTQRPAWLSRFCFTECQRFYVLRTIDRQDRKRVAEVTPYPVDVVPPPHYWGYWDASLDDYQWYSPVPVDGKDYGYHDDTVEPLKWL